MNLAPSQFALSVPGGGVGVIFVPWEPQAYYNVDDSKVPLFALSRADVDRIKEAADAVEPPCKKRKNREADVIEHPLKKRENRKAVSMITDLGFFDAPKNSMIVHIATQGPNSVTFSASTVDHAVHMIKLRMFNPDLYNEFEKKHSYGSGEQREKLGNEIKAAGLCCHGVDSKQWNDAIPFIAAIVCFYRFQEQRPAILDNCVSDDPEESHFFTMDYFQKPWGAATPRLPATKGKNAYPKGLVTALRWYAEGRRYPPVTYIPQLRQFITDYNTVR
jgi:hypothetical protein